MNLALPLLEAIKPSARALKYFTLRSLAEWKIRTNRDRSHFLNPLPFAFIVSCGRSGTTILGDFLGSHPQVKYLYEPYYLWTAIDRQMDVHNLFERIEGRLLMDDRHVGEGSRERFDRLFRSQSKGDRSRLFVEKTPLNALRIGYLEAIAPGAKFVHLVRDGAQVCHSIARLATENEYKIAGKPALNQWWGVDGSKWKALQRNGIEAGYYPEEAIALNSDLEKAAYEWLVTLHEIDRWREPLGDRFYELTYSQFLDNPRSHLQQLCTFLELDSPQSWLDEAVARIRSPKTPQQLHLKLPPAMATAFDDYQKRYQFANLAEVKTE